MGVYLAIDLGGLDAMQLIARGDYALSQLTGSEFDLVSKVDPQLGKIGVTLVLNGKYFVERKKTYAHTNFPFDSSI